MVEATRQADLIVVDQGFDFLGVHFVGKPTRRRGTGVFCYGFPTAKAMKHVRQRVREELGRDVRRPLCPCRRGSPRQATVRSSAFRLRRVHPPGRVAWCKTPPVSPSDIGSAIDRPPRAPATATRRRLPVAVCAKPACADGAGSRLSVNPDRQSAAARCHCAAASAGSADSVHADAEDQHLVPPLGDDQFRLH